MQKALWPAASGFVIEVEGSFNLYLIGHYFSGKKVAVGFNVHFSILFISLHKVTKFILFSYLSTNGIHFITGKCSWLSNYILIALKITSALQFLLILHHILLHLLVMLTNHIVIRAKQQWH